VTTTCENDDNIAPTESVLAATVRILLLSWEMKTGSPDSTPPVTVSTLKRKTAPGPALFLQEPIRTVRSLRLATAVYRMPRKKGHSS
jgi:hypothetical protein